MYLYLHFILCNGTKPVQLVALAFHLHHVASLGLSAILHVSLVEPLLLFKNYVASHQSLCFFCPSFCLHDVGSRYDENP